MHKLTPCSLHNTCCANFTIPSITFTQELPVAAAQVAIMSVMEAHFGKLPAPPQKHPTKFSKNTKVWPDT